MERGTGTVEKKGRYFDPYTGADVGDAFTRGERALYWVVELHDNLLFGMEGKFWNGVGSIVVTVTCLTGLVISVTSIEFEVEISSTSPNFSTKITGHKYTPHPILD
jgi:uncharacterized iron-regulated membrane protein